ncbi:3-deoxy-D-manno-octulosonic acid kinase [Thalassotalea piscium]|uniref:3-deoxy-D-manno-octulosonic acid kinase n=1 Tax=Thalassotalea piscium TaxID=1230533 RepID=A0A7X0NES3_9GAMM|nr:3-deoxy-D-manno-octulosonic acid kinase [Thalassotalea piscium]MBB6542033.1 3-deoxy-D-manno-octulosonic acid kinase [Thalassotalea piscium]
MNPSANVKHCQQKVFQQKNLYAVYNPALVKSFTPEMLTAQYWQQHNAVIGQAQGRGITYFVQHNQQQWVLRHYYRGGLIGKFNRDSYLFTGDKNTRAAKEYQLLQQLVELNLPAPTPIAYAVIKQGIFYHANILTSRIENAQDLVALLSKGPLAENLWLAIGRCIAQFHQHGIFHHDLNAHNILLDTDNKVWLIDFDQGEKRAIKQGWQQANISRLLRSFNKELQKLPTFHWQLSDWQLLMEGYLSE